MVRDELSAGRSASATGEPSMRERDPRAPRSRWLPRAFVGLFALGCHGNGPLVAVSAGEFLCVDGARFVRR